MQVHGEAQTMSNIELFEFIYPDSEQLQQVLLGPLHVSIP